MREVVRWGGLITLSLLAHLFLLDLMQLTPQNIERPVPHKIRISLSALAAPVSKPAPSPSPQQSAKSIPQPSQPTTEPFYAPKFEHIKSASIEVAAVPAVKSEKKPQMAQPVQNISEKIEKTEKRQELVPTPRLIVKKPTLEREKPTLKIAEAPKEIQKPEAKAALKEIEPVPDKITTPIDSEPAPASKSVADNTGQETSTVIHEANYKRRTPPSYPRRAYDLGQQGIVTLAALIEPNGRTGHLKVEQSSGHRLLDKAAIAAVKKWEFEPLTRNGEKVSSWVRVPVKFIIN